MQDILISTCCCPVKHQQNRLVISLQHTQKQQMPLPVKQMMSWCGRVGWETHCRWGREWGLVSGSWHPHSELCVRSVYSDFALHLHTQSAPPPPPTHCPSSVWILRSRLGKLYECCLWSSASQSILDCGTQGSFHLRDVSHSEHHRKMACFPCLLSLAHSAQSDGWSGIERHPSLWVVRVP